MTKDLRGNIEAFEMQCYRRSMKISYRDHVPNETVLEKVDQNRKLLPMVKSRKLNYFGQISCHTSLEKDIMLGTMPGIRRQGGQRKEWSDDLVEWAGETIPVSYTHLTLPTKRIV